MRWIGQVQLAAKARREVCAGMREFHAVLLSCTEWVLLSGGIVGDYLHLYYYCIGVVDAFFVKLCSYLY